MSSARGSRRHRRAQEGLETNLGLVLRGSVDVSQGEGKDEVVYDEDRQNYRKESLETESSVNGDDGDNGFDLDAVNARAICIEELTTDVMKAKNIESIRTESAFSGTGFLLANSESCSLAQLEVIYGRRLYIIMRRSNVYN